MKKPLINIPIYAMEKLEECGFVKSMTSLKSISSYYTYPNFSGAIRVSDHKISGYSKLAAEWTLQQRIISKLTFESNFKARSMRTVDSRIALSIGEFFMKQKRYQCPPKEKPVFFNREVEHERRI